MAATVESCRIRAAGKAPGFLSLREGETRRVLAGGFLFLAVHTDVALLVRQTEALVKLYKPS